jgi:hypothetical protein
MAEQEEVDTRSLGLDEGDDSGDEEEEDILDMDDADADPTNPREALLMRFCPHDSSMLYPQVRSAI